MDLYDPRKLYAVVNNTSRKTWCGPAVVCAVVGQPMSVVYDVMKSNRHSWGRAGSIKGTFDRDLRAALNLFGFEMWHGIAPNTPEGLKRLTVARWLRQRKERKATFILQIKTPPNGHWVVIRGNKFVDSWTNEPTNIREAPHRRAKVRTAYRVYQKTKRRKTAAPMVFKLEERKVPEELQKLFRF